MLLDSVDYFPAAMTVALTKIESRQAHCLALFRRRVHQQSPERERREKERCQANLDSNSDHSLIVCFLVLHSSNLSSLTFPMNT